MQHGFVQVPLDRLGLGPGDPFTVTDLLTDTQYWWRGEWNYVRFDPEARQGHVLSISARGAAGADGRAAHP
jgi:starch synthase (maltosyl-transferring)